MNIQFITIGADCSPAAALRELNLRQFALPFDWVQTNVHNLKLCFHDNFEKYHQTLKLNNTKTRLVDTYGFQFPHDYPFTGECDDADFTNAIGEYFPEIRTKTIIPNWHDFHHIAIEKYQRRIERFNNIMNESSNIIIMLCRYPPSSAIQIKNMLQSHYHRENIFVINSNRTEHFDTNNKILHIHTEKNNKWNDSVIWNDAINKMKEIIHAK